MCKQSGYIFLKRECADDRQALIIKEMQIKTTRRYHLIQSQCLLSKTNKQSAGKDAEKEKSRVALTGMKISAATAENRAKRL